MVFGVPYPLSIKINLYLLNKKKAHLIYVSSSIFLGVKSGGKKLKIQKKMYILLSNYNMAEEVGFEPTEELPLRRFSRPVHSTALSLLRVEYLPYFAVTKADNILFV